MFLQEVREFAAGSHVHPSFATPLAMNRSTSIPSEGAQETKVSSVPLSFAVPDPEAGAEDQLVLLTVERLAEEFHRLHQRLADAS